MSIVTQPPHKKSAPRSVMGQGVDETSDSDLVTRAQRGDPWAEAALFRRHAGKASQLASRLLGRTAEADDVVQDSLVIALEELPKLRDGAAFRSWLLRIVLHQAHRRYRKRRLLSRLGFSSADDTESLPSPARDEAGPEMHAELRRLDGVLSRLGARERSAWVLRHVEGYQLDEVALACECSLATAKRWICRADERVRAHVTRVETVAHAA